MASWLPSNIEEWLRKAERRLTALERRGNATPVGDVRTMLSASTLPAGYLWMEGQSLLRADYPVLFAMIGTAYGAADATHFSLPNTKGKVIVGMDDAQPLFNAVGKTGGEINHVLTKSEMPSHRHTIRRGAGGPAQTMVNVGTIDSGNTNNRYITADGVETLMMDNEGGNIAHNNLQPFIVMRYAIRVT